MSGTTFPVTIKLSADGKGLEGTLRVTEREARRLQRGLDDTGRSARTSGREMQNAGSQVDRLGARAQSAGMRIGGMVRTLFLLAGIGSVVAGIGSAGRAMADFEQQMAGVRAVTQPTAQEFDALSAKARELGASTEFSAGQAASGMRFLGQAGFNAAQQIAAIGSTLDLATAGQLDLAQAADITSNVLSGFRMRAEEADRVADALAKTSASANTNVSQLGDAMAYVAPVASALGLEVEGAAGAIGVLSDAGIQGSAAGTGLRRVLSSLANPSSAAEEALRSMGITLDQVNPATNELTDIVDLLAARGLTAADALTIFGDRGGPAILALTSQNERLRELTGTIEDSEGAASAMADTMRDTLQGDINELGSAIQELALTLGETGLLDALRAIVQFMTGETRDAIGGMQDNMLEMQLAGIATVYALRVAFNELTGVWRLQLAITTEIFSIIGNTWNWTVATILEQNGRLVSGLASAADFVPGMGRLAESAGEIAERMTEGAAAARAKIVEVTRLDQVINDYRNDVNQANRAAADWADNLVDGRIAADQARRSAQGLGADTGELAARVADASDEIERFNQGQGETIDAGKDLIDQLTGQRDRLREQVIQLRGGTRALLEYRLATAIANGATQEQIATYRELLEEVISLEAALDDTTEKVKEYGRAWDPAMDTSRRAVGAFAAYLSGEIETFRDFADTIVRIFERMVTDMIDIALQQSLMDALLGEASVKDALGDFFRPAEGEQGIMGMSTSGFQVTALAAGQLIQAVGGNSKGANAASGAAQGAAAGAVFGPWGAAIGAVLGGIMGALGSQKDPKFQLEGADAAGTTGGRMRGGFQTDLGLINFRFRNVEDAAQRALINGLIDMDRQLAALLAPTGMLPQAQAALRNFSFDSADDGSDPEAVMQARFDAVLDGVATAWMRGFVRMGANLEDQMQRWADAIAIEREIDFGRALGLDGLESTLTVVDDLRRANETLGESFQRLVIVTESLDTAMALTGNVLGASREDVIRFGDALSMAFGDNLERAIGGLNRIFDAFFSDEERAEVAADRARDLATGLLEQLGLDVTDEMLTQAGFRDLFDELFGSLSPEDTALLIEAGVAIADLIDAEEALAAARGDQIDTTAELAELMSGVSRDIQDMQWSPLRRSMHDAREELDNTIAAIERLGGSEADLALARERYRLRIDALEATLRSSLIDSIAEFTGQADQAFDLLGNRVQQTAAQMGEDFSRAFEGVQRWLDRQLLSNLSTLTPTERLGEARGQFDAAMAAIMAGDFSRVGDMAGLADQVLREGASYWGTSTDDYATLEAQIRAAMQQIADMAPAGSAEPPTFAQTQAIVSATESTERSAADQLRTAARIVDELAVLAGITERSPAELLAELGGGDTMADIIQALTGELPDLTGDALAEYFDELVAEQDLQLEALGTIESLLAEQMQIDLQVRDFLERIAANSAAMNAGSGLPSYRVGSAGLDRDQIAQVHRGEKIIDPTSAAILDRYGIQVRGGGDPDEMRALRAEIRQMREEMATLLAEGNGDRRRGFDAVVTAELDTKREIHRSAQPGSRRDRVMS